MPADEVKLMLKIKKKAVDNGKRYARKRKTTLSKVIEKYLDRIATEEASEITPLVKSLSGVVKPTSTADKSRYASFLAKKYR